MIENAVKNNQLEIQNTTELKDVLAILTKYGHQDQTLGHWLAEEVVYALKRKDTVARFQETVQRVLTDFGLRSAAKIEQELCTYYWRASLSPEERAQALEQNKLRNTIAATFRAHGVQNGWLSDWVFEVAQHNRALPTTGTPENFRMRVREILKANDIVAPALVDDLVAVYEGRQVVPPAKVEEPVHNTGAVAAPVESKPVLTAVEPLPPVVVNQEESLASVEEVVDPDAPFREMVSKCIHLVLERFGRPNTELKKWLAEEVEAAQEKKYTREQFQSVVARVLEYFNLHKNSRLIIALTECYLAIPAKEGYEPPETEVASEEPVPAELAGRAAEFVGLLFTFLNVRNPVFEAHFRELYVELLTRGGVDQAYLEKRLRNVCEMHRYGRDVIIEEAVRFMRGTLRFQESAITTLRAERDKRRAKEQKRTEQKQEVVQRVLRPIRRLFNGRLSV